MWTGQIARIFDANTDTCPTGPAVYAQPSIQHSSAHRIAGAEAQFGTCVTHCARSELGNIPTIMTRLPPPAAENVAPGGAASTTAAAVLTLMCLAAWPRSHREKLIPCKLQVISTSIIHVRVGGVAWHWHRRSAAACLNSAILHSRARAQCCRYMFVEARTCVRQA